MQTGIVKCQYCLVTKQNCCRIPGVTRLFIYPTPESCSLARSLARTHARAHTHRVFIYPKLLSDKRTNTPSYTHIRFLYIHIVVWTLSLVEIAPGVDLSVWCHLSANSADRRPKFRYFTVLRHRTWRGWFTYLLTNFFFIPTFISNQKFTIYKLICCGVQ
jgi:hypothetical protein